MRFAVVETESLSFHIGHYLLSPVACVTVYSFAHALVDLIVTVVPGPGRGKVVTTTVMASLT